MPANLPMNILGMPIFVDYYTIHDPIKGTVGFAPHSASLKDNLQRGEVPTNQFIQVGSAA